MNSASQHARLFALRSASHPAVFLPQAAAPRRSTSVAAPQATALRRPSRQNGVFLNGAVDCGDKRPTGALRSFSSPGSFSAPALAASPPCLHSRERFIRSPRLAGGAPRTAVTAFGASPSAGALGHPLSRDSDDSEAFPEAGKDNHEEAGDEGSPRSAEEELMREAARRPARRAGDRGWWYGALQQAFQREIREWFVQKKQGTLFHVWDPPGVVFASTKLVKSGVTPPPLPHWYFPAAVDERQLRLSPSLHSLFGLNRNASKGDGDSHASRADAGLDDEAQAESATREKTFPTCSLFFLSSSKSSAGFLMQQVVLHPETLYVAVAPDYDALFTLLRLAARAFCMDPYGFQQFPNLRVVCTHPLHVPSFFPNNLVNEVYIHLSDLPRSVAAASTSRCPLLSPSFLPRLYPRLQAGAAVFVGLETPPAAPGSPAGDSQGGPCVPNDRAMTSVSGEAHREPAVPEGVGRASTQAQGAGQPLQQLWEGQETRRGERSLAQGAATADRDYAAPMRSQEMHLLRVLRSCECVAGVENAEWLPGRLADRARSAGARGITLGGARADAHLRGHRRSRYGGRTPSKQEFLFALEGCEWPEGAEERANLAVHSPLSASELESPSCGELQPLADGLGPDDTTQRDELLSATPHSSGEMEGGIPQGFPCEGCEAEAGALSRFPGYQSKEPTSVDESDGWLGLGSFQPIRWGRPLLGVLRNVERSGVARSPRHGNPQSAENEDDCSVRSGDEDSPLHSRNPTSAPASGDGHRCKPMTHEQASCHLHSPGQGNAQRKTGPKAGATLLRLATGGRILIREKSCDDEHDSYKNPSQSASQKEQPTAGGTLFFLKAEEARGLDTTGKGPERISREPVAGTTFSYIKLRKQAPSLPNFRFLEHCMLLRRTHTTFYTYT
ncbi:hypothetical protein BESB_025060 [Besnoitia besnoiti]|uniref:Uncharacterized protein n=1 Tax=Besnoitia besnoiti TaxID=94643 RepID=A0A2A9M834_BESBE|nr:uncharacterized protein BESB_025060 [Besnoitia besnoiti]PFH31540.1 hypothetical protein BESB_025060 [Besnoitia besnoiti]